MQVADNRCSGRLWLGRLDRVSSPAAGEGDGARWRMPDPKLLQLPADRFRMSDKEKNWVPFIYDDTIHFLVYSNPPVTFRMPAAGNDTGEAVTVEFVSSVSDKVHWRYGSISGGTPGVYDADLGGYVTVFHSKILHHLNGSLINRGKQITRTYYMGALVFAARPPFRDPAPFGRPVGWH